MSDRDIRYELHPGDGLYPTCVGELSDAPRTLYVRGNPAVLSEPSLSIIGARKASPYGIACSELAAKVATQAGLAVVSGGALGCDQASGWAALNEGGRHIVVLGTGADVVYPRSSGGRVALALGLRRAQVRLSTAQSRYRRSFGGALHLGSRHAVRYVFHGGGGHGPGKGAACRPRLDTVPGIARDELPDIERCLLHRRRGVHRDRDFKDLRFVEILPSRRPGRFRP